MLDSYKHECPACGAAVPRGQLRCPGCHKLLPRSLSRARRITENTLLGVALAAAGFALLVPDLARRLFARQGPPATAQAATRAEWPGPGPEPAARAWALPLEGSLQSACKTTFASYSDRKFVTASLLLEMPWVLRDLRQPMTPEAMRLTPDEEKDALAVMGDEDRFRAECLRWGYDALGACQRYKANLNAIDSTDCMVKTVEKALTVAPFNYCASAAKLPRVKRACALAAERVQKGHH